MCQEACKPGSVLQAVCSHTSLAAAAIHLGEGLIPALKQPTRASQGETPLLQAARGPYLALLRVGFAMRALLPEPRCAFTAPFHPCLYPLGAIGGILSVALSLRFPSAGVTRHPCFVEPGLSS